MPDARCQQMSKSKIRIRRDDPRLTNIKYKSTRVLLQDSYLNFYLLSPLLQTRINNTLEGGGKLLTSHISPKTWIAFAFAVRIRHRFTINAIVLWHGLAINVIANVDPSRCRCLRHLW
jgi:hypothetical protein